MDCGGCDGGSGRASRREGSLDSRLPRRGGSQGRVRASVGHIVRLFDGTFGHSGCNLSPDSATRQCALSRNLVITKGGKGVNPYHYK